MQERLFPVHLLEASKQERLDYFESLVLGHASINHVQSRVMEVVRDPGDKKIIFVAGPTGVGKKQLVIRLVNNILSTYEDEMKENGGMMPVLQVVAPAQIKGPFDPTRVYVRIMEAANEPLINRKISLNNACGKEEILEQAARKCLKNRQTKVVIIDEAQQMAKVTNNRKVLDQLDAFKSFVDSTEAIFILVGTYTLTSCFNASGQISRRSTIIHFPRYRERVISCYQAKGTEDSAKWTEYNDFVNIVKNFESRLPTKGKPNFSRVYRYVYVGSVGCVGILKNWLFDALRRSLNSGHDTVTKEDLIATALEPQRARDIYLEAYEGEAYFNRLMECGDDLAEMSGQGFEDDEGDQQVEGTASGKEKKTNSQPGQRKQSRDPVGTEVG